MEEIIGQSSLSSSGQGVATKQHTKTADTKTADPSLKIMIVPLNGRNFKVWAKYATLYLCGKSKAGYINGKIIPPNEDDPAYEEWEANDRVVMSWHLNSMEPVIAESFLFLNSAREVWDSLQEIYGEGQNLAKVYLLQQEIARFTKGDKPFYSYLGSLKAMWDELAQYRPIVPDLATQRQRLDEDKTFKLLAGLGPDYEHLKSQILMSQPLPQFNSVCSILQREETVGVMIYEPKYVGSM